MLIILLLLGNGSVYSLYQNILQVYEYLLFSIQFKIVKSKL
jgi:hypothetical protein